ncbi:MAG: hypothetical protein JXR14_06210 [Paracoccaceae bacterium]
MDGTIIPFDTYNLFYRDEAARARHKSSILASKGKSVRNLGIAFLALVALFVGGCSLLLFGAVAWDCGITENGEGCLYGKIASFLAVIPFILSVGLGRLVWNIIKGNPKWGRPEYILLAAMIVYIIFALFFPPRGL